MDGELAQYFALATHASGWLHDPQAAAPGLDASRSVVQFVGAISFDGPRIAEPDVESKYERVSRTLFAAVMRACVAAANADPG